MKRIIKLKKIKKANYFKKALRKKKNNKRSFLWKNICQLESPHNNNEYLIKNCSSPFFADEEDFLGMGMKNISLVFLNPELDLFDFKDLNLL